MLTLVETTGCAHGVVRNVNNKSAGNRHAFLRQKVGEEYRNDTDMPEYSREKFKK